MMNKIGLYIHVPFCIQKCLYCDFYSLSGREDRMERYIDAIVRQLNALKSTRVVDTVYIGGGTPSMLPIALLEKLLKAVFANYNIESRAEITLEANPATVEAEDDTFCRYRALGINRISFGVQSSDDFLLKRIGRKHNFAEAVESINAAKCAGFENISADLMYALPGQTTEGFLKSLSVLAALEIPHISMYGLKIEDNTPFGRDKTLVLPDEEEQCAMYLGGIELLAKFGYRQYEISNFAKDGFPSRHNLRYWKREEYLGFGPSAHSFFENYRFSVGRDLENYCACTDFSLSSPIYEEKQLIGMEEAKEEELLLALRLTEGFSEEQYLAHAERKMNARNYLDNAEKTGYIKRNDGNFFLTPKGMLVSNTIISDLMLC